MQHGELLALLHFQIIAPVRVLREVHFAAKAHAFSTNPGSIACASAVPREPVTKSFCTSTTTSTFSAAVLFRARCCRQLFRTSSHSARAASVRR